MSSAVMWLLWPHVMWCVRMHGSSLQGSRCAFLFAPARTFEAKCCRSYQANIFAGQRWKFHDIKFQGHLSPTCQRWEPTTATWSRDAWGWLRRRKAQTEFDTSSYFKNPFDKQDYPRKVGFILNLHGELFEAQFCLVGARHKNAWQDIASKRLETWTCMIAVKPCTCAFFCLMLQSCSILSSVFVCVCCFFSVSSSKLMFGKRFRPRICLLDLRHHCVKTVCRRLLTEVSRLQKVWCSGPWMDQHAVKDVFPVHPLDSRDL